MYLFFLIFNKSKKLFLDNIFLFFIILLISLFCIKGYLTLDPDFGWRIKTGELILSSGVPKTDPFTYSMSSFPFVDHAWSQSVFMSFIYFNFGKIFLALIYTLIALITLKIVWSRNEIRVISKNNTFYSNSLGGRFKLFGSISFLLAAYIFSLFFGVRAQIVSWLMLAVLLYFILKPNTWSKIKIFSPFFFFLWANLHGSFFLGLSVYLVIILVRSVKTKKILYKDFLILLASAFSTLVNPYNLGIWREVASSIMDVKLKWTIVEWMPALTMLNLPFAILVALSLVFVIKQFKIFLIEEVVLYFIFLLAALSTRRHLPLWSIVTLPMLEKAINNFYLQVSKIKGGIVRFKKVYKIAWVAVFIIVTAHAILDFNEVLTLREGAFYPKDAVVYLNQNTPSGEIFSEYGWGGYLIWKLPEKKVFIDGRMPSWRWEPSRDLDTGSAFDDYNDIIKGELEYKDIFNKYNIDTVLWSKTKEKSPLDKMFDKIEKIFIKDKKDFELTQQLEKDSWQLVFEDNLSVVYSNQAH